MMGIKIKKIILLLIMSLLIVGLTGCFWNKQKQNTPEETQEPVETLAPTETQVPTETQGTTETSETESDVNYKFVTGTEKGAYYPVGNAIIEVCSKDNVNMSNKKSAGSTQNVLTLAEGDADFALVQGLDLYDVYTGNGAFKDKENKDISAICSIFPSVVHFVVDNKSEISSISDLKGKDFAVGSEKSITERNSRDIFKAYGIDYKIKKDLNPKYTSFTESTKMYNAKKIIGGAFSSENSFENVTSWYQMYNVKMLSIDDASADKIIKENPGYYKTTLKAKTYSEKQTDDVKTLASNTILVVNKEISEDVVYKVLKNIIEKQGELEKANEMFKTLKLETVLEGVSIPLHKGAVKYLNENSVEIPDNLQDK
jgi:TRAP transporter TAXI family solute receptor